MTREAVSVFEVGPRDGLQNEHALVALSDKIWFVRGLLEAGIRDLELGAFVRPDRVPQMADTDLIFEAIRSGELDLGKARAWSLIPNRRGLERALEAGVRNLAVFTAATESFTLQNIGMTIAESLSEFGHAIREAKTAGGRSIRVRGYVSTAFGCPFEGKVAPKKALRVIEKLADLGVDQISIGDTIGVATPAGVDALIRPAFKMLGRLRTAVHFHDTRGTALANALRALEIGVRVLDSSAGGLGGCPFAPGASGNLATEDLVYMLDGMGFRTGIHLGKLCETSSAFSKRVGRVFTSKYLQAYQSKGG